MRNKNNSEKFSGQWPLKHITKELISSFPLGQHRMNKRHKAKGGLPSKGWDQTGARIERKEETMPKVIKVGIREKKGAEHPTTHPHDFFLG
jgi:hypothetical protein